MRHREREITEPGEIREILRRAQVLRLAMCKDNQPYVVTLNYGLGADLAGGEVERVLYVHSAVKGKKIEYLHANPQVCFSVETDVALVRPMRDAACEFGMRYRSIVGYALATVVQDEVERRAGLEAVVAHYTDKKFAYDEKVLAKTAVIRLDIDSMTAMKHNMD
jgi:hypothetical protein